MPPARRECGTCHTPVGAPALRAGVRTRAVRGVGVAASVAVVGVLVADLARALWPLAGGRMAERAVLTGHRALFELAQLVELIIPVLHVGTVIVAGVLVIIWLYRARTNLEAFPGASPTLSGGWAIAGWFVPFANLVIPCRVMVSIARDSVRRSRTPWLVGIWWPSWLVYWLVAGRIDRRDARDYPLLMAEPASPADYRTYVDHYAAALGSELMLLPAGGVAAAALIILIRRISVAQEARIARGATGPVPPGMTVPAPTVPGGAPTGGDATIGA